MIFDFFVQAPLSFKLLMVGGIGAFSSIIAYLRLSGGQPVDLPVNSLPMMSTIELPKEEKVEEHKIDLPTAADYLGEEEQEEKPEPPAKKPDEASSVFDNALNEKIHDAVMSAKLSFRMTAPVKVKDGKVFVDVQDGEIGELVIENEKESQPPPVSQP